MFHTSNHCEAPLPHRLAEAIFDIHDWLASVAEPDAELGRADSAMLTTADRLLLGEENDAAAVYAITLAALAEVEDRWTRICSDDHDCRVLTGFIRRSQPVDELAERWAEAAGS